MASASSSLPQTSASAPPNFYSNAGQMAAQQPGGGGASGGSTAGPATPGSGVDPAEAKSEFVQNMAKLLKIFQAMGKTKPNGVDIKKYTDAMAQIAHDMMEQVSTGGEGTPDTDGGSPADVGSTGPPAAAGAGAGAASGSGASGSPAGA